MIGKYILRAFLLLFFQYVSVFSQTVMNQTITVQFYKQVNNYITQSTILNLQFSADLPTISTTVLQNAIDIKLKSLVSGVDFTWQIQVNYLTNIYVKQLYLYFINPYAIHDLNKNYLSLDSYTISVEVGPVVNFESYQNTEINVMTNIILYTICIFCGIYLFLYSIRFLKESLNLFWAWVDLIQLYNLFLFIDTSHFENVSSLLRKCAILNFWYIDFLNKYSSSTIMQNARETPLPQAISSIPYTFIQEQYTSYFLQNAFFPLFIIGGGLVVLIASFIVCPASRFGLQNTLRNMIQFSLPIRGTMLCCCQIFLSACLFFKNFGGTLSITFSIISIVYYILCILAFAYILNRGQPIPLGEQLTKEKYGSLYEGLILKAVFKRNFNIFFMLRKIIMSFCLVFLNNSSMVQMIFILVIQIIFMGVIASKLPYENGRNNLWMVLSEFLLSIFLLLMSAWVIFDYLGEDFIFFSKRLALSWAIHSTIVGSIATRVIGFIQEFFFIYHKEKEQQKLDQKLMQNDSSLLDETNGVKQKLIFYHDNLKDNPQANPNEDIENPDDFQFIEMPDINELIKKEEQNEKEELEEKEKMTNRTNQKNTGGQDQNDNHQGSDDEDGNHKHSNSANNETNNPDKINTKI